MKTSKLLVFTAIVLALLTVFSCEDPIDYSQNVNDLVSNAGHFNEPVEYDPMIQGSPIVTTETDEQGVDYQVTTTNYKRAKKIESYKSISSSKKDGVNLKTLNDIYLGSIIQGKYWAESGDLTSIGDFARTPITITVDGVVLANGNSLTVESPSKATVTEALNTLLASDYSGLSTEYTFQKSEAYSKNQAGLELGFKPAWLGDMFSVNFSIENTFETNTVVMYFKQKYYSVEVNLPGSPSDFFADDVDFPSLETKITPQNPAGYISSIDFGRVIMAKVTSSYSASEIKASVEAAFSALSINIGGHSEEVLRNCQFEVQVLGGSGSPLVQDAQGVIDLIDSEMTPAYLTSAKPIEYHVSYLDGAPFKIGDVVEYSKIEYIQTTDNQNFDVTVFGFYVYNDCDFWSSGDFSYTININGQEISQNNITCSDGAFFSINQTKTISLPNISGQKIVISGELKEDDELVKSFTKEFTFPWNDADLVNDVWTISGTETEVWDEYLQRASDCDASLLFKIVKK